MASQPSMEKPAGGRTVVTSHTVNGATAILCPPGAMSFQVEAPSGGAITIYGSGGASGVAAIAGFTPSTVSIAADTKSDFYQCQDDKYVHLGSGSSLTAKIVWQTGQTLLT